MTSLILFALASFLNASMDMCFNMYSSSKFSNLSDFWNPAKSWRYKWKNGDKSQGEAFFGSSTFLVWATDGWHLLKAIFLSLVVASIILYTPIFSWHIDIAVYGLVWFIFFELSLKLLKK